MLKVIVHAHLYKILNLGKVKVTLIACLKMKSIVFKVEYYFYFQALGQAKDITALWTNRAQAYIKLGEYEKALNDCDWALRVSINFC